MQKEFRVYRGISALCRRKFSFVYLCNSVGINYKINSRKPKTFFSFFFIFKLYFIKHDIQRFTNLPENNHGQVVTCTPKEIQILLYRLCSLVSGSSTDLLIFRGTQIPSKVSLCLGLFNDEILLDARI